MKNVWKKTACFVLLLAVALTGVACGSVEESGTVDPAAQTTVETPVSEKTAEVPAVPEQDPDLLAFVEENGEDFISGFEESFNASGQTCKCKLSVKGTTLVIDCLVNEWNDFTSEQKKIVQEAYDETKAELTEQFKPIKSLAPTLTNVVFNICEADGDVLATLDLEM